LLNQHLQPMPWCRQSRLPRVLLFCRYHIDMWLTGTCIYCSLDVEVYLYLWRMKGEHNLRYMKNCVNLYRCPSMARKWTLGGDDGLGMQLSWGEKCM
jgi:hypothetical protein